MTYMALQYWSYDRGYVGIDSAVAAKVTAGTAVRAQVLKDLARDIAFNTWMTLTAMGAMESIAWQLWTQKSDDEIKEMFEGWSGEDKKEEEGEDKEAEEGEEEDEEDEE